MITYIEKGNALHEEIRAQGYSLRQENGVWISNNDAAVQVIINSFDTLAAAIKSQKAAIDTLAKKKRDTVVGIVSPAEMAKWQSKYDQCKRYKVTPVDTTAPDIATEAAARGITTDALATKIITKGDQLSVLEARISGIAGKHADAVSLLTDFNLVLAYDFTIGWPV